MNTSWFSRFEGKPRKDFPRILRCAQALWKGRQNFVIPWKTSTAVSGLLLMAVRTALSLSNVKSLMSPTNP